MDAHYTPSALARSIVAAGSNLEPEVVADLAAGRGDLLLEAERIWPSATFVATDIDPESIAHLSALRPDWIVGRCDLRNSRSRSACHALRNARKAISLLLLNPPFSCRGGTKFSVPTRIGPIAASTAMSFLLLATDYVAENGTIVVILPLGCMTNLKDVEAWNYLKSRYDVYHLSNSARGTFRGSSASTAIVRLSPPATLPDTKTHPAPALCPKDAIEVTVTRGCCQPHRSPNNNGSAILVHYTDIRDGSVELNGRRGFGTHRCIQGPALIIPRVGRITRGKVAILSHTEAVMLSDCVIAITPKVREHLHLLRDRILENFGQLRASYVGTGAPFVTLGRLHTALSAMGVQVG